jgi:hypothetical protein
MDSITDFDVSSGFDAGQYSGTELTVHFCSELNFEANKT